MLVPLDRSACRIPSRSASASVSAGVCRWRGCNGIIQEDIVNPHRSNIGGGRGWFLLGSKEISCVRALVAGVRICNYQCESEAQIEIPQGWDGHLHGNGSRLAESRCWERRYHLTIFTTLQVQRCHTNQSYASSRRTHVFLLVRDLFPVFHHAMKLLCCLCPCVPSLHAFMSTTPENQPQNRADSRDLRLAQAARNEAGRLSGTCAISAVHLTSKSGSGHEPRRCHRAGVGNNSP